MTRGCSTCSRGSATRVGRSRRRSIRPPRLWGAEVEQHGTSGGWTRGGRRSRSRLPPAVNGSGRARSSRPPLTEGHAAYLDSLLGPARELGFTVPQEAAVHVHLDGGPFRDPAALANVVRLFGWWREPLRTLVGTNERCRRLAALPAELVDVVRGTPSYAQIREAAAAGGLTKFFDVNLTQLLSEVPLRDTLEVRILPGAITAADIIGPARVIERLLDRCRDPVPLPRPSMDLDAAVAAAPPASHQTIMKGVGGSAGGQKVQRVAPPGALVATA